jgi:3',5'-cyclic AMP phosphodiesterase CpdA
MIVAQISDPHVVAPPGQGKLAGVDTAVALERALAEIEALCGTVYMVLATGDLTNLGEPHEYEALAAILARAPGPVRLLPGNHDDRAALRAAFPDHAYLQGEDNFIQYAEDVGPLRLIALDTTIPGRHDAELDRPRLDWLRRALDAAKDRPVLMAMHHPPFETGMTAFDALPFAGRDDLEACLRPYSNIERIVCGHLHRAVQRQFAGTSASVCPSTAFTYGMQLAPGSRFKPSAEPPGYQIHHWTGGRLVTHTVALPVTLT